MDEGAVKGSYEQELGSVTAKRVKLVVTTRVTNELQWADDDAKLQIVSRIQAPEQLQLRTHNCPDGTVVTILRGGNQAFLYAYLDNSFFEEEISGSEAMTDAFLLYQNIGK